MTLLNGAQRPPVGSPERTAATGRHLLGVFCVACHECIDCYGDEPCRKTPNGKHVAPRSLSKETW